MGNGEGFEPFHPPGLRGLKASQNLHKASPNQTVDLGEVLGGRGHGQHPAPHLVGFKLGPHCKLSQLRSTTHPNVMGSVRSAGHSCRGQASSEIGRFWEVESSARLASPSSPSSWKPGKSGQRLEQSKVVSVGPSGPSVEVMPHVLSLDRMRGLFKSGLMTPYGSWNHTLAIAKSQKLGSHL